MGAKSRSYELGGLLWLFISILIVNWLHPDLIPQWVVFVAWVFAIPLVVVLVALVVLLILLGVINLGGR